MVVFLRGGVIKVGRGREFREVREFKEFREFREFRDGLSNFPSFPNFPNLPKQSTPTVAYQSMLLSGCLPDINRKFLILGEEILR